MDHPFHHVASMEIQVSITVTSLRIFSRDLPGDGVLSFKEFSEQEPDEEGITAPET